MTDISPGYGVTFLGPFVEEHRVIVEGHLIPHLTAHPSSDGQAVTLILDRRFIIDGPADEVAKWAHFVANAMAVAAGYSNFKAEHKHESFATPVAGIKPPPPNLKVVPT